MIADPPGRPVPAHGRVVARHLSADHFSGGRVEPGPQPPRNVCMSTETHAPPLLPERSRPERLVNVRTARCYLLSTAAEPHRRSEPPCCAPAQASRWVTRRGDEVPAEEISAAVCGGTAAAPRSAFSGWEGLRGAGDRNRSPVIGGQNLWTGPFLAEPGAIAPRHLGPKRPGRVLRTDPPGVEPGESRHPGSVDPADHDRVDVGDVPTSRARWQPAQVSRGATRRKQDSPRPAPESVASGGRGACAVVRAMCPAVGRRHRVVAVEERLAQRLGGAEAATPGHRRQR